jgi:hypothetical protein
MRTLSFILPALLLGACEGDTDSGDDDDTNDDPTDTDTTDSDTDTTPVEPDCVTPGNVCTWLGVPMTAMFSGEGTNRSGDFQDPNATFLFLPQDITFTAEGVAYYPDFNNHRIRRVDLDDTVHTVSGTGFLGDGPNDSGSVINCWVGCPADTSAWNHPTHVAVNPADETQLYVSAWHNSRMNIIDTDANTMTWYAGTGGRFYGSGLDPATALPPAVKAFTLDRAVMDLPSSIAFGADGTLYVSDQANHMIRKVAPGSTRLEIVVGKIVVDIDPATGLPVGLSPASTHRQPGFEGDGGLGTAAKLHGHTDQKADPGSRIEYNAANNSLLITDSVNGVIREWDIDTGIIETIIGKYTSAGTTEIQDAISGEIYTADAGSIPGYSGDGGDPLQAVFNTPRDVAIGIDGEIYVADTKNHCVRVVKDGVVNTFAGICDPDPYGQGFSGDGGPATEAMFSDVFGVGVDPEGNVYIADSGNHVIRRVAH